MRAKQAFLGYRAGVKVLLAKTGSQQQLAGLENADWTGPKPSRGRPPTTGMTLVKYIGRWTSEFCPSDDFCPAGRRERDNEIYDGRCFTKGPWLPVGKAGSIGAARRQLLAGVLGTVMISRPKETREGRTTTCRERNKPLGLCSGLTLLLALPDINDPPHQAISADERPALAREH